MPNPITSLLSHKTRQAVIVIGLALTLAGCPLHDGLLTWSNFLIHPS